MPRPLVTTAILLVLAASCGPFLPAHRSPEAQDGRLDLSDWNWSWGPASLDGEWEFEGRKAVVPAPILFAGSPYGVGTYRLTVTVPAHSRDLALGIPLEGTSYILRSGGRILAQEGTPGDAPAASVPSYRPRVVLLPDGPSTFDLEFRVANWHDRAGGLYGSIVLGPWQTISADHLKASLWEALVFGALGFIGLYYTGSFVFRMSNRAPLWFGLFCIFVALRSTFYSETIFLQAFPDASWYVVFRWVHLTMALATGAFAAFVDRLYPDLSWRPGVIAVVALGALYGLVNLWAPLTWTSALLPYFQGLIVVTGLGGMTILFRAARHRRPGALLFFFGLGTFLGSVVIDIVRSNTFWQIPSVVNVGLMAFVLAQALVVAQLFANSLKESEERGLVLARINASLERFIPKEVLGLLGKRDITEVELGDYAELRMTVFFLDIRDFTSLSEAMGPEENFRFINSFLKLFGPLVRSNGGFVDKYLGDGIMALFPRRADDALAAALTMRGALLDYNDGRVRAGYAPVRFGIGLHTGPLMLGTIGENQRMDSTVISDTVNAASRLEGLTKKYGADILLSGDTVALLEEPDQYTIEFVAMETVKGKVKPIAVYRLP